MEYPELGVLYLAVCGALGWWNWSRGNGFWFAFLYSLILTPLTGAVAILIADKVVRIKTGKGIMRTCPYCFALTTDSTSLCHSCGRDIKRQTRKDFLTVGEFVVGIVTTIIIVTMMMQNNSSHSEQLAPGSKGESVAKPSSQ
ncbi:MAG: hypothetical protein V1799_18885 [bacterium]